MQQIVYQMGTTKTNTILRRSLFLKGEMSCQEIVYDKAEHIADDRHDPAGHPLFAFGLAVHQIADQVDGDVAELLEGPGRAEERRPDEQARGQVERPCCRGGEDLAENGFHDRQSRDHKRVDSAEIRADLVDDVHELRVSQANPSFSVVRDRRRPPLMSIYSLL